MRSRRRLSGGGKPTQFHMMAVGVLCIVLASMVNAQTARIKRISLMTPDLDVSIMFIKEVIGFMLDFEGTLPPDGEPVLGPVLRIDATKPIRRALFSTKTEPRGLFLIEHKEMPPSDLDAFNATVTVIQVPDLYQALTAAGDFGTLHNEVVSDVTPEGLSFSEALITSPGGHAVLVYEVGVLASE